MFLDRSAIAHGSRLEADVCVVGGGAAGITIARALAGDKLDVLLLEGGERQATKRSQSLYDGAMVKAYRAEDTTYLHDSRQRRLGGSTNEWMGWCLPMDPIDFEARPWIPLSGWPIGYDEVAKHYPEACGMLDIPAFETDHGAARTGKRTTLFDDAAMLQTRILHFSRPTRFGKKYLRDLTDDRGLRVLLGANVLRLRAALGASGSRVTHADVRIEGGGPITVAARRFVLACGGIENPRLLLLSDRDVPTGLGNDADMVGRCFADHPHCANVGEAVMPGVPGSAAADLYLQRIHDTHLGVRSRGLFVLDAEVQRKEQLQNASIQFSPRDRATRGETRAVAHLARTMAEASGVPVGDKAVRAAFYIRGEVAPNRDSRVTLDPSATDRFGQARAKLDWRLHERDAASIQRTLELLALDLGALAAGRGRLKFDLEAPWEGIKGGYHHLGTTRMAAEPKDGVVDANCRVHGLDNLFVAGSSVFPTTGHAHPTLTIVALALRLAEHLAADAP